MTNDIPGQAALSICESLLLAMKARGVLPEHEIVGVLRDAAATHENAITTEPDTESHKAVATLINTIIAGGYAVRHSRVEETENSQGKGRSNG